MGILHKLWGRPSACAGPVAPPLCSKSCTSGRVDGGLRGRRTPRACPTICAESSLVRKLSDIGLFRVSARDPLVTRALLRLITDLPLKYPPVPHQHPPNRPMPPPRAMLPWSRDMRQTHEFHAPAAPKNHDSLRCAAATGKICISEEVLLILKHMWVRTYKNPRAPHAQKRTKTHKKRRVRLRRKQRTLGGPQRTMVRPTAVPAPNRER
jgi:hypothetical protein